MGEEPADDAEPPRAPVRRHLAAARGGVVGLARTRRGRPRRASCRATRHDADVAVVRDARRRARREAPTPCRPGSPRGPRPARRTAPCPAGSAGTTPRRCRRAVTMCGTSGAGRRAAARALVRRLAHLRGHVHLPRTCRECTHRRRMRVERHHPYPLGVYSGMEDRPGLRDVRRRVDGGGGMALSGLDVLLLLRRVPRAVQGRCRGRPRDAGRGSLDGGSVVESGPRG